MTLKAALLGKELSHSISPQVHGYIFDVLRKKLNSPYKEIEYSSHECEGDADIKSWILSASLKGFQGANVTIPYKTRAAKYASIRYGATAAIESANSLLFHQTITKATSTDGPGFFASLLREHPEFNLENYHLVLLGAGATAKAVVYALCTKWMPMSLTIVNRTKAEADKLAEFCVAEAPGPTVRVMSYDEFMKDGYAIHYRMIIQATPVGNVSHPGNLIEGFHWHETDLAVDLTYNPIDTEFLKQAREAGAKSHDGLGMLVEQAAYSQYYWMKSELPEASPLSDDEYYQIKQRAALLLQ
ncbi:MAG TPA: shikimate dehydrogenase [Candidatus Kapabacteria bacterium]